MRLRLPLGWLSSLSYVLLIASLFTLTESSGSASDLALWGLDWKSWANVKLASLICTIVFALCLITCLIIELLLRLGWEPKKLRKLIPEAYVQQKFVNESELGLKRYFVLIRMPSGHEEEFECDLGEFDGLSPGDCVHLYVIGPYVESYRHVPTDATSEITNRALSWGDDREIAPFLRAYGTYSIQAWKWLLSLFIFTFSGMLLSGAILITLSGRLLPWGFTNSLSGTYGYRYIEFESGGVSGVVLIAVALLIWFFWLKFLQRGVEIKEDGSA
ncbi:MAG: hypothetical protein KF836_08940 [Fimbriimonadaceae bacterium]|nr:hypothetical protein [Fimbriimonadaceae bacterium]